MTFLIVIEKETLPSSRIRYIQLRPYLEDLDADIKMITYPRTRRQFSSMLSLMRKAELVLLQKRMPNPLEMLRVRLACRRLVFDYDDAICYRDSPRNGSYRSRSREFRFRSLVASAKALICGNKYLAGLANTSKPVLIYPSPVPTDVPVRDYDQETSSSLRIGWVGLGTNLNKLDGIIPDIRRLSGEIPLELVIISDRKPEIEGIRVVHHPWSKADQENRISRIDIGIMPLDGTSPFDRGKCSYKLLQYMASGVIPVADAVGMNRDVIDDGRNGRLVFNNDWYPVLKDVARMTVDEKRKISENARQTILAEYDYPGQAKCVMAFLDSVRNES